VDPVDFKRATAGLDPETTLVVIVSKTFTTAETMLNARTMRAWLLENIKGAGSEAICRQHIVACSSALSKTSDFGIDPANVFGFWDWVGGRFSIHSAVGMVRALARRSCILNSYLVNLFSLVKPKFYFCLHTNGLFVMLRRVLFL